MRSPTQLRCSSVPLALTGVLAGGALARCDKVNDLRTEFSTEMLTTLQSKLGPFGVDVMNVKITDVFLPRELQQRLEQTTAFGTRISEQEKNQKFSLQQMSNTHAQSMAAVQQSVELERQRIAAETAR